ncbi:hypothetical protein BC940DRAFT_61652 [Gongronella butleri]|nr:hypothetical protein BC940DRAFT_61652 [Gongronella butleri]
MNANSRICRSSSSPFFFFLSFFHFLGGGGGRGRGHLSDEPRALQTCGAGCARAPHQHWSCQWLNIYSQWGCQGWHGASQSISIKYTRQSDAIAPHHEPLFFQIKEQVAPCATMIPCFFFVCQGENRVRRCGKALWCLVDAWQVGQERVNGSNLEGR